MATEHQSLLFTAHPEIGHLLDKRKSYVTLIHDKVQLMLRKKGVKRLNRVKICRQIFPCLLNINHRNFSSVCASLSVSCDIFQRNIAVNHLSN